jgi:hypothetical protein
VTSPQLDVLAIGDAIVDVIATTDEAFLRERGIPKGGMQLLTTEQADELYAAMGPAREMSGGSAANTMAGIARLPTISWEPSSSTTCSRSESISPLRPFSRRRRRAAA